MTPLTYYFRLYYCSQDMHYHIVAHYLDGHSGSQKERIAEPFWTFFGGMQAVDSLCHTMLNILPLNQHKHLRDEMTDLRSQIWNIPRESYGIGSGIMQAREATVPKAWQEIFTGQNGCCSYPRKVAKRNKKVMSLPFFCDFIVRPAFEKLSPRHGYAPSRRALYSLAKEPAIALSLEELNRLTFQNELKKKKEKVA